MIYRELGRTGLRLSVLGFGTAPLGDEYGNITPRDADRAVKAAIAAGINFFDTSPYYGRTLSEKRLGEALKGNRDKVVLSTKCGRYDKAGFDFSAARVRASIDESLERLQTDYVDILIAHDIEFGDREQVLNETLPALRDIQRAGKARVIGVSGLPLRMLADVARKADIDLVLSYCHYDLLARDLDTVLRPVVESRGMGLINASPLHMGLLSTNGPPPWHPAPDALKWKGAAVVALVERFGFSPAQVALRFCLDYPAVASTLVGMTSTHEVEDNLQALNVKIPPELLHEIETIIAPVKDMTWPSGRPENSDV
jgi:L-galactose dehydrogenase